jgi:S-adenosylmethionine:tRNA ribosyltransferase-isomerase
VSTLAFELPPALEAGAPPEARGLRRDEVKLMVAHRGTDSVEHATFRDLPRFLRSGDLLVINISATLPAAISAHLADGSPARVHFSTRAPHLSGTWWVIELRTADGAGPLRAGRAGERIELAGGAVAELVAPFASGARLMLARLELPDPEEVPAYLRRYGEPIRYSYARRRWSLDAYQTVYAREPGSAEMPSAGRPITTELLTRLIADGILVSPIVLHAGVSSPERHEPPYPEYFEVPATTARLVSSVRASRGRVVAVGTTVVRALETVAQPDGTLEAAAGWTNLIVGREHGLWAVDGLITGWHEPEASHLSLLEAAAGTDLISTCYAEALERGYRWHEFGDSHLVLP